MDAGLANRQSMSIPLLIKSALARGEPGVIGEGRNVWPFVEIHEGALFRL